MRTIHETIVRDIVDIVSDIKNSDEVQRISNMNNKSSWKSITRKSEALTLVFPVLASKNISYSSAAMICKAIERKAVVMLQILFSAINISDAKDGFEYLSKFHTNLDTGNMTVDKFIDVMDTFVTENSLITESSRLDEYENIKRDLVNMNFYLENNVNDESLNDYKVVTVEGTKLLIKEDSTADILKTAKMSSDIAKTSMELSKNMLLDGDVKKANELVPTMVYVNYVTVDAAGTQYPISNSMIIGIKAKLYAVESQDILNRLKIKNNDKNLVLNLIKAGTREISFLKDFVFAINKAKIDALSQSRRGSSHKIWKVLERRSAKSRMKRGMFLNNDAAAISTLVISQEEVEYLKKTDFIDVEVFRTINPIMDAYNLMGFVIVDEALEIAKFLFDGSDSSYEILTFNNLERESKDNSKKIINLMSKIAR